MKLRIFSTIPFPCSGLCLALSWVTLTPVLAQTSTIGPTGNTSGPASGTAGAASGTTGPGSNAPGTNAPAPGVAGSVAGRGTPSHPLTLAEVVQSAVGDNSGLVLARQRLQKAQELVNQVNAQARPQFRVDANNTYSSYPAFAPTLPTPAVSSPTLPGGGQIPTVVDQAGNFSTAFVGGGGGGSAPASGGVSSLTSGGTVGGTTSGASLPGTANNAPGAAGNVPTPSSPSITNSPTGTTASPTAPGTSPSGGATTPGTTGNTGTTGTPSTTAPGTTGNTGTTAPGGTTTSPSTGDNGAAAPGGTTTPPNSNGTAAPDNAGGTAAPGTGTAAPDNGGGTAAPGTGTTTPSAPAAPAAPAGGTAAPAASASAFPALLTAYVAEPRSFLASTSAVPSVSVRIPSAQTKAASGDAVPRRPADDTTGTGGTTTGAVLGTGSGAGKRNNYAARASVSQYIPLFGLLQAARGAQQDVQDFYAIDITRLQNETALAAKNIFFNVLATQAQVATEQEQVAFAEENVRVTQSRLRQGVAARFDVLTAQTALAAAQQQLIAAQDQAALAQSNLAYLLGTNPDQPLTLQTPPLPPLTQTADLAQSTRLAERQRPELAQAAANVREARRLVRLAGSDLLPTVGVVGSGEYASIATQTAPQSYATISAEIALPLDDGGATRSRVRSAQVDVQTQTLTQAQLQQSVSLEVRQATVNVRSAQAQVEAAQTGVAQAQEAVRLANLRYRGGLGTFLDVLNALAQLVTTRTNLSNAEYFYQTSLAQLVRDLGGR